MREIRLSEAAKADLVDIWRDTAAKWGAGQADSYLDDIDLALNRLLRSPKIGPDCSDLLPGARRLIVGRHLAFYEISGEVIRVIRVLHHAMDGPRHLRDA